MFTHKHTPGTSLALRSKIVMVFQAGVLALLCLAATGWFATPEARAQTNVFNQRGCSVYRVESTFTLTLHGRSVTLNILFGKTNEPGGPTIEVNCGFVKAQVIAASFVAPKIITFA